MSLPSSSLQSPNRPPWNAKSKGVWPGCWAAKTEHKKKKKREDVRQDVENRVSKEALMGTSCSRDTQMHPYTLSANYVLTASLCLQWNLTREVTVSRHVSRVEDLEKAKRPFKNCACKQYAESTNPAKHWGAGPVLTLTDEIISLNAIYAFPFCTNLLCITFPYFLF